MKIKELYSSSEKWIKRHYAIDKNGLSICSGDEKACAWCLSGAICKCYPDFFNLDSLLVRDKIREAIGPKIVQWNDAPERTFEEVKELVEKLDI